MPRTLPSLLDEAAAAAPDRDFLRAERETRTYAQMAERSRRVAAGLDALGLRRADRVAIAAPNGVEWLEFFYGALRLGLVVVTLNVRYRQSELDYMLNQSGARLVLTAATAGETDLRAFYDGFRSHIPTVEHLFFLDGGGAPDSYEALLADRAIEATASPAADDPAVILYTSGTTGAPKGAVLTHAGITASAEAQAERVGTHAEDVHLGVMPLNHVGGLTCTVTVALLGRATVVMPAAFSPTDAVRIMADHGVTVFAGVPTMWSLILSQPSFIEHDTSALRLAIVGGSNAEPALCEAISAAFPNARLSNLYGMSETSGAVVLSAVDDEGDVVARTLGTPLHGVDIRVVDLEGVPVASGSDGELQVRGPVVAAGYWEMPEQTVETFLPGGWLATGDIVSVEPAGHVVLRGRRKDMFVQGGYNVYPVEVENVLTRYTDVAMAAGIGIADPVLGEIGRYYVVPHEGAEIDTGELLEYCRDRLADYKVPREIVVVAELPMTASGKIAKASLRQRPAT